MMATLLEDARTHLREIHVVSLDVAKAFDSVSHHAISAVLGRTGLPGEFTNYTAQLYANSTTRFEVEGVRSEPFQVRRGVRQGDPLSSLLFCLVVDEVLRSVPRDVGYEIGGCRINAFAYADDIILVSSTGSGMVAAMRGGGGVSRGLGNRGSRSMHARACVCLSYLPVSRRSIRSWPAPSIALLTVNQLKN